MSNSLQDSVVQAWNWLQRVDNIGGSDDPRDLYYVLDYLAHRVQQMYPQIPCQEGCSRCCVDAGLPRTSALEWRQIHRYILEHMEPQTQTTVVMQNYAWHADQLPAFMDEQERILQPVPDQPRANFACTQCPFLVEHRCSIYPVRPAICRGYGYFTVRRHNPPESQVFACQMAADTLIQSLQSRGIFQLALPVWNKFFEKLYELNRSHVIATLPLWIFSHEEHGNFQEHCNLRPNFNQLWARLGYAASQRQVLEK